MESSPTPSQDYQRLPNEIIIHIVRYALHAHRITPRLADSSRSSYPIRNLSLVSKSIRSLSRDIFYGENTITVQRMLLPSQLFTYPDISHYPHELAIIRVPSPTIGPLIKKLDIFITIHMAWLFYPTAYLTSILAPDQDLGVLVRPINAPATQRTQWQKNMTALEDLRIVFKVQCNFLIAMTSLARMLPWGVVVDLRPRRLVVEVELIHNWRSDGCSHKRLGAGEEMMRKGMGRIVQLRGDD